MHILCTLNSASSLLRCLSFRHRRKLRPVAAPTEVAVCDWPVAGLSDVAPEPNYSSAGVEIVFSGALLRM